MAERDETADQSGWRRNETREPSKLQPVCETDDRMICERCGAAEMYRMHAVWRCPACGFKTDCCGW